MCGYETTSVHLYIKVMLYIIVKNMNLYNIKTMLKTLQGHESLISLVPEDLIWA